MRVLSGLVFLILLSVNCGLGGCAQREDPAAPPRLTSLQLDSDCPPDAIDTGNLVLANPNNDYGLWNWSDDGIEYRLGIDEYGAVRYISTFSSEVATDDGICVGMPYSAIREMHAVSFHTWQGWGHLVETSSGWKAAFFVGKSGTGRPLKGEDKVRILFRGSKGGGSIDEEQLRKLMVDDFPLELDR